MKNKYSIASKLILAFYVLVTIVGAGQISWEVNFGDVYESPDFTGFYWGFRLILCIAILTLFALRTRTAVFWVMAIDSAINIFSGLFCIYPFLWCLLKHRNVEIVRIFIEIAGLEMGWNSLLTIISGIILGYSISSLKNKIPNQNTHSITASGGSE